MFEGDWTCSGCSGAIKELPFEPRSTENLLCKDCHSKSRPQQTGERTMVQGDWSCSGCGTSIKELPFNPRETGNLKCKECFKASRA